MDDAQREKWKEINALPDDAAACEIELLKQLVQAYPDSAAGWFRLGRALSEVSRFDEALPMLHRALALHTESKRRYEYCVRRGTLCISGCIHEAYLNLGYILRAQERYEEAAACFQHAIDLDPEYEDAQTAKADVERAIELRS